MSFYSFVLNLLVVIIQYFDYHMLGLAAPIISKYFFPSVSKSEAVFYTFSLISVSYFVKPLGAIVIGRIGDIYGRYIAINMSLLGTVIASISIAFIPTYSSIGFLSILLLLLCRMMISIFVSSGSDGVRIFVYEKIGKTNKALGIGLVSSATMLGTLLSNVSLKYFHYLDSSYTWRIPFLIGGILGCIVLILRIILYDNYNYIKKEKNYDSNADLGIFDLIKGNMKGFGLCVLLSGCLGGLNQFYIIFLGTYYSVILDIVSFDVMIYYRSFIIASYTISCIISGIVSDKLGVMQTVFIAIITMIMILWYSINNIANNIFDPLSYIIGAFILPFIFVPSVVAMKKTIDSTIRYRIFNFSHALGSIMISGTTNSISSFLASNSGISYLPILYFMFILFIVLVVNYFLNKSSKYS